MAAPGYVVNLVTSAGAVIPPVDTGTLFTVGKATTSFGLSEIFSIDQFLALGGARDPSSHLYDGLDAFFHEGGSKAYVAAAGLSANDSAVLALLTQFTADLGPGQETFFGNTVEATQQAIMADALAKDRVAILDALDSGTAATVIAQANLLTASSGDGFSGLFAPWDLAPGIVGGTQRTIPPSARICGNIAKNDAQGISTNTPSAGDLGIANWVQGLSQSAWTDSDRSLLNAAGVNVSKIVLGQVRTYGWRTLASQTNNSNWSWLSNARCIMQIKNDLNILAERFAFKKIDGAGHTLGRFQGEIMAILHGYWENDDLYGATPADAYTVDVGPSVNTITTIAAGELHAKISLRTSEFAEREVIDLSKIPITESLAA